MASDKKSDDNTMEMGSVDASSKAFDPPVTQQPRSAPNPSSSASNNAVLPVLAYCGSSILMTVMNKYVLSGLDFNLNFFLLCVQV
jgi:GDP-mannose transporter